MIAEYQVYETEVYTKWFASLNDERAKARIDKRIDRAKYGNFGDWKTAGIVQAERAISPTTDSKNGMSFSANAAGS